MISRLIDDSNLTAEASKSSSSSALTSIVTDYGAVGELPAGASTDPAGLEAGWAAIQEGTELVLSDFHPLLKGGADI